MSLTLDAELPAAALAAMSCVFSDGTWPGFNVIFAQATAAADGKSVRAGCARPFGYIYIYTVTDIYLYTYLHSHTHTLTHSLYIFL